MKKYIFILAFFAISLVCPSQAIHIFHDGETTPDVIAQGGIDSIYFAPKFIGSAEYQQIFATQDGEMRYDKVDSIKFNLPHLRAHRHTLYYPSDGESYSGYIYLTISRSDDKEDLILTYTDGTKVPYENAGGAGSWCGVTSFLRYFGNDNHKPEDSETWYISSGEMKDSVTIIYSSTPLANNQIKDICFSLDEQEYVFDTNFPASEVGVNNPDLGFGYINNAGKPVIHIYKNESGKFRDIYVDVVAGGFKTNTLYFNQLGVPFKHTKDEHMGALRDFCDATDYDNWGKKTNWWTDAPLWEWGGYDWDSYCFYGRINHPGGHPYNIGSPENYKFLVNDHVLYLDFNGGQYTGVHGNLPASFETIMDDAISIDLRCCALYGEIPYNIRHSKNWSKFGWRAIQQNPWYGGGFDMEDINLRMKDEEIMYADGTKSTAYKELKKHKLTLISVGVPSEAMCNLCLSYANKGFQYVYAAQDWMGGTLAETQQSAFELKNVPNVTVCYRSWANGDLGDGLGALGSTFLLDSEGNVIDYAVMDWDLGEELYTDRLGNHLLKYLGEPEQHDPYVPNPKEYYTSSDYTHDGEVMTLQKSTIGKGIDLVFMGDMYVDTMLVANGKYEQDMQAAMDYFFEVEPYKSFRDRFNVYAVKVVSPNDHEGPVHKLYFDNDLVFDYARNIPNVDMDNVTITVINNRPDAFVTSGEANMWESGASIAYIINGGPSTIICHEAGGHGFAKLLDEYVYGGYENNHTQVGTNAEFREWIKTDYHDKGWGMNISATDNPDEVPWSRFLKDERYKDEVGIYKGAWLWPEELWRPSENSVMNSDYSWFNAPSREAIYKRVMQLSEGDGWTYDYETFVAFDAPIREANKQAKAKARTKDIKNQDVEQRRIELRPPTIYKGSWRDAGRKDTKTSSFESGKILKQNNSAPKAQKTYYMYKGQRFESDKFDKNLPKNSIGK